MHPQRKYPTYTLKVNTLQGLHTPSKVTTSKYPTYTLKSKYPTYTLRTLMNLINLKNVKNFLKKILIEKL